MITEHKGKLGKELLLAVRDEILAEPLRLDMGTWLYQTSPESRTPVPACHTMGCIAGWAVLLHLGGYRDDLPFPLLALDYLSEHGKYDISFRMRGTRSQYPWLFHISFWPSDLKTDYGVHWNEPTTLAAITARAIDRFISEVYEQGH